MDPGSGAGVTKRGAGRGVSGPAGAPDTRQDGTRSNPKRFRTGAAYSAAAAAFGIRQSSGRAWMGSKSRCAIHSARLWRVMWFETAQRLR